MNHASSRGPGRQNERFWLAGDDASERPHPDLCVVIMYERERAVACDAMVLWVRPRRNGTHNDEPAVQMDRGLVVFY